MEKAITSRARPSNRRAGKGTKALNLLIKCSSPLSLAPHPSGRRSVPTGSRKRGALVPRPSSLAPRLATIPDISDRCRTACRFVPRTVPGLLARSFATEPPQQERVIVVILDSNAGRFRPHPTLRQAPPVVWSIPNSSVSSVVIGFPVSMWLTFMKFGYLGNLLSIRECRSRKTGRTCRFRHGAFFLWLQKQDLYRGIGI